MAQYAAQLGPGEHFECHAHPLHGMCILLGFVILADKPPKVCDCIEVAYESRFKDDYLGYLVQQHTDLP